MMEALFDVLAWANGYSVVLGWAVVLAFVASTLLEFYDREYARPVAVAAWLLFGLFWFSLVNYYLLTQKSAVEGIGTIVAIPLSVWIAYLLAQGRDSLFVLSRAIAAMGVVYVPFVTIEWLRRPLIEIVTDQTAFAMGLVGYDATVVGGMELPNWGPIPTKMYPYDSTFVFYKTDAAPITYTIRIACTGIGSMAIIAGLVAAVRAPLHRKLRALAIAIPIIWALNIVRNVFIGLTFGEQLLHVFPTLVTRLFALSDPRMVSYIVSDRIISQSLSVVALVAITWLVVRELPEVLTVLEDFLYLVTGREYDLQSTAGAETGDRSR